MSIEKIGNTYTPICDSCGTVLDGKSGFYDAVAEKKTNGWRSKKYEGDWMDFCPDCQTMDGSR